MIKPKITTIKSNPAKGPSTIIRRKAAQIYRLFAICPGGLEPVLRQELNELQVTMKEDYAGGIEFEGDLSVAYTACLSLRTASRVFLLLHETKKIFQPEELYQAIQEVEWHKVFSPNCTFAIYVTETHTKERRDVLNTQFWALKAKDAIVDQFRVRFNERPSVDRKSPDITIKLHLHDHILKIYLDLSGKSLHERGYRAETLEAPLKENLAAGLLLLSGWAEKAKKKIAFYDPFCGSGTLLIEAAMIATQTPPGLTRHHFGFFSWKDHIPSLFEKVQENLKAKIIQDPALLPQIVGSDIDHAAVRIAEQNIKNAGLSEVIKLKVTPFEKTTPFAPQGLIVSNPPYGVRLSEVENLIELYSAMGSTLKHQYKGWDCGVISSEKKLLQAISLKPSKKMSLHNGGLESFFYIFNLY